MHDLYQTMIHVTVQGRNPRILGVLRQLVSPPSIMSQSTYIITVFHQRDRLIVLEDPDHLLSLLFPGITEVFQLSLMAEL